MSLHPDREFAAHLEQGKFMLLRSVSSGRCFFHPRIAEPGSGDTALEWVEACGRGTVYSTTVVRKRPPEKDYNVALIDLEEGPRMMSRVDGIAPQDVRIGMPVMAEIVREEGVPKVVFRPAFAGREGDR